MNPRIGKIGRLPRAIREELNQRLSEGEGGEPLLDWLNALPEVQQIIAAEFGGKPVSAQNLSTWRQGAYADWVAHGEAMELAQRLGEEIEDWKESEASDQTPLSEKLMVWLTARYAVAAQKFASLDEEKQWERLREFAADMLKVRKAEQNERRLRLVEEKAGVERKAREAAENASQAVDNEFLDWKTDKIRRQLWGNKLVDEMNEEDERREREQAASAGPGPGFASNSPSPSSLKTPEIPGDSTQFKASDK
ncbi:MAG TPA: hypothetical protein VHH73_09905 [Verrucomicrobiae bacterium]|nr:hypothetical protein [Verrucomicrobiae bacterium]